MSTGTLRLCPICRNDDRESFLQKGQLSLVRCRECRMIYLNSVEPDLADGKGYERMAQPYYLSPDKLGGDHAAARFEREIKMLRNYCLTGAVLDVGCSTGGFLNQLRSRYPGSYRLVGTDVATTALDYAAGLGIEVQPESFLAMRDAEEQFDAVTFWAVLEHVTEPRQLLGQAARLLRPQGYCFILVPNWRSLAVRVLGKRYRYIMKEHVNYFAPATLMRLGQLESSCDVVGMHTMHFNPLVIYQDLRQFRERVPDEERSALLQRTTRYKQSSRLAPLRRLYDVSESLLARLRLADNLVLVLRKKSGGELKVFAH